VARDETRRDGTGELRLKPVATPRHAVFTEPSRHALVARALDFPTALCPASDSINLVTPTAKKTNEWVPNKAGVKRELLDTVKARKLAYYGHTMRKQGSCREKETMQGTMPGARRRGRPCTAWSGQHQDVDGTVRGRVSHNDRGQG